MAVNFDKFPATHAALPSLNVMLCLLLDLVGTAEKEREREYVIWAALDLPIP